MDTVSDAAARRCAAHRVALGGYVLGGLEPGERADLEEHLAGCAACRDELSRLAVLPGLLARTSFEDLQAGDPSIVADRAERAIRELSRRRHQARRRRWLSVAAAVVVMVAGSGIGIGIAASGGPSGTTVQATDASTHVSATVGIRSRPTGTAFTVQLAGVNPGERCRLVAISRSGAQDTAASWVANYQGKASVSGESAVARSDLRSVRVVTAAGRQLVTIPVRSD